MKKSTIGWIILGIGIVNTITIIAMCFVMLHTDKQVDTVGTQNVNECGVYTWQDDTYYVLSTICNMEYQQPTTFNPNTLVRGYEFNKLNYNVLITFSSGDYPECVITTEGISIVDFINLYTT